MIRSRVASAAGLLLLAWAAVTVPVAGAQTPSPSPSGSGATVSPSAPASSTSPTPQTESLALLVAAEPATVDVGAETLLVAQVTNTGTATLPSTSVSVTLPGELELVSSFPKGTATAAGYSIDLGPLDPGASVVAQVTVRGLAPVEDAVVSTSATGGSATAQASTPVSVVEGAGGVVALKVHSRTRQVLTQVGSMVHYEVTVANEGRDDLENVLVVDVAPQEVDVVSVDFVDEVEAVQIGESGGRHDIVWNVGSLPAGASVTLPWDGRAVQAGDLRAVNSVRGLVGTTETTRSSSESFLAAEGPRDVDNPPFEPIQERVVTFVDPPPPSPAARAAGAQPVVLPLTGISISRIVLAGVLLVFGGLLIVAGARLASRASRRAIAAAILAGLVGVACVSGGGDDDSLSGAANGATPRTFGTDDPRDDDTRVKGERIVRGEDEDQADDTSAPSAPASPAATAPPTAAPTSSPPPPPAAPTATPPPAVAAPAVDPAPAPDPAPIRTVRVVTTELEDLPVATQTSRDGDNTVSFGWDEAAGGITSATSGRRFTGGGASELLTDLTTDGGALVNRLTLRNTAEATRLRVDGRLVHEVYAGTRLVARLRSAPIDVVLAPGGEVVARFSYLVPTGDYTVLAAFEAD